MDALFQYLNWQVRSRLAGEIAVNWVGGTKLLVRRGMTGATGNIYCVLHEYREMALVLHALVPGDLFVDVGANVGSYTILSSGVCGASTIAIEPVDAAARHLARNLAVNGIAHLVQLQVTAVGDRAGAIAFTSGLDTMNRVASDADDNVQTVHLARIDDILQGLSPTLIKLDIEGYETQALRGAVKALSSPSLQAVMLETVDPEALEILHKHGYDQFGYDPRTRSLVEDFVKHEGSNALFVRNREAFENKLRSAPRRFFRGREL